jgi:hypothetical protein
MIKRHVFILASFLFFATAGCITTPPPKAFKVLEPTLQLRQIETRQFDIKDELKVLSATAAVLQDMGFTLTEVEKRLGLIVGSKERDATVPGQVVMATFIDMLGSSSGSSSNAMAQIDAVQTILVSCVTRLNLERSKVFVRVNFQRVVYNRMNQVSRLETLKDPKVYEGFFNKLSKSIFLEADKI